MDVFYLMRNSFEFFGYLGLSSITFSVSENSWKIIRSEDGEELAERQGTDLPLGKNPWNFRVGNCDGNILKLHLDVDQPGYFCCDDGLCIDSQKVCDGTADCQSFRNLSVWNA